MPRAVLVAAELWILVLVAVDLVLLAVGRSMRRRLLALDVLSLLLASLLLVVGYEQASPHFLDAALVIALLGFVAILRVARYQAEREDQR